MKYNNRCIYNGFGVKNRFWTNYMEFLLLRRDILFQRKRFEQNKFEFFDRLEQSK
jgi:hypothetical protein